MTHADRWWATYNAAVAGISAQVEGRWWKDDDKQLDNVHDYGAQLANLAHGELDAVDIASLEHIVEDVINNAQSLALDDEDDRNRLIVALQQAIKDAVS